MQGRDRLDLQELKLEKGEGTGRERASTHWVPEGTGVEDIA